MTASFYRWHDDSLELDVYVQPRASRDEIIGPHGEYLKIRITAPPVDGKANAHLIKYLSRCFAVPRSLIRLLKGETGRHKRFQIQSPQKWPACIKAKK